MPLFQLHPQECNTTAKNIVADTVTAAATPLPIAAAETKEFCSNLSALLLESEEAAPYPELASLGNWLRPASISQVCRDYLPSLSGTVRIPAGIVFQIPPSNVDTIFGYTAIISLLCGNTTIVRLSSKRRILQEVLATLMSQAMAHAPAPLRDKLILLRYDHDDAITTTLSTVCNLRIVWGKAATVANLRSLFLPPLAQDTSFGDRFSLAAIDTASYLALPAISREDLSHRFASDLFRFDQQSGASPRLLLWIGDAQDSAKASEDFYTRLVQTREATHYNVDTAVSMEKLSSAYLALHDLSVADWKIRSPALTTLSLTDLKGLSAFKQVDYGFGLLLSANLAKLTDYAAYADPIDQTLTFWGFSSRQIRDFMESNRGGVIRVLPIGQALAFDPIWDGVNLFETMTRLLRTPG